MYIEKEERKKILPKISGFRLGSRTREGVGDHIRQAKGTNLF
jgi:hypothetical protein